MRKIYKLNKRLILVLTFIVLSNFTFAQQLKMFYVKGVSAPYSIYSANLDGTDETLIVSGVLDAFGGYGGGKICFHNGTQLKLINPNGCNLITVPNTTDATGNADVSPDGTKIIYGGTANTFKLFIINTDGTGKLTFNDCSATSQHQLFPCWNETGLIVFGMSNYGDALSQRIYSKPDNNNLATPTLLVNTFSVFPASGGPGNKIAYNDLAGNVYIMNSDGSNQTQLTAAGTNSYSTKAWDLVNGYLYYINNISGNIWKIKPDNTGAMQITTSGGVVGLLGIDTVSYQSTKHDTTICQGKSVLLQPSQIATSYLWSTGATTQSITVNSQGTYWVQTNGVDGCIRYDTINVFVNPLPNNIGDSLIPSTGLLAYYPFNSNANDYSGNGYNGTAYISPTYSTGIDSNCFANNKCINLVGNGYTGASGDYVSLPTINFNSMTSFSISIWVYEKGMSSWDGEAYIGYGEDNGRVGILHIGNNLLFQVSINSISIPFNNNYLNNWVHYTLVYNNGIVQAYINGGLAGTLTDNVNVTSNTAAIGRHWWYDTSTRFIGKIDEARVYNRALSYNEIQALTNTCSKLSAGIKNNNICINSSTEIYIINPQPKISYQLLKNGTAFGNPQIGQNDTITFNTGNLTATTQFTIKATDTVTSCNIILDTIFTITVKDCSAQYPMNDTTICKGSSVTFKANAPTTAGIWEYNQDFEGTVGSEWSDSTIFTFNNTKVLGPFSAHSVNLNLNNLPVHDSVEISFDLYPIDSWDGNQTPSTSDYWSLFVNNDTLIHTTFTNPPNAGNQAYPQNYPSSNPPYTGVYLLNLPLRCCSYGTSSLYKITRKIANNSNSLQIKFDGEPNENICNESWSMDNVKVKLFSTDTVTHYLWSTGDTSQIIIVNPAQTTTYIVTVTKGAVYKDTATVFVMNLHANLCIDNPICKGESVSLSPIITNNNLGVFVPIIIDSIVDFSWQANPYGVPINVPRGTNIFGGIPFTTPLVGNNAWNANYANGPNPRIAQVFVTPDYYSKAYFLINSFWGRSNISYCNIKFHFNDGSIYTKELYGDNDFRDYYQPSGLLTNINNVTTINMISAYPCVLDLLEVPIPCSFTSKKLTAISIEDNGIFEVQRIIISGITLEKSSSDSVSFLWSTSDTTQTIKVAPNQTTTYSVNVTNSNGCSASDSIAVNIINIEAGANVNICQGDSTQLNASGGLIYTWTPTAGLSNPTIANPIAKPSQTTAYYVSALIQESNLIFNGSFELGNTGFSSDYIYTPPINNTANQYWITTNASNWSPSFYSCNDHTSGFGKMMVVNGSTTLNNIVWKQNVIIKPNTVYNFSAWFQNIYQTFSTDDLAKIQLKINNNPIGVVYQCPSTPCLWGNLNITWNSGNDTIAVISIVDQNILANSNDFAIDDISFSELHACGDSVVVTVAPQPQAYIGSDTTICKGDIVKLTYSTTICGKSQLPTNLQQGLVAFYPFCGNANDESGNGNNGTVNGATLTIDRFGNANSAYSFDGVSNYIKTSNQFFDNGWQDYTITGWICSNNINKAMQCFFNTIPHTGTDLQLNYFSNDKLSFFLNSDPGVFSWNMNFNTTLGNFSGFTNNIWYHYAFVKNGNNYKYYLNGLLDVDFNSSITPISYLCNVVFGSINPSVNLNECFSGKLDDIQIYNRNLTQSEVEQLYTLGSSASSSLLWSTGDTTQTITVSPNQTTNYSLTVTNSAGCSASDTITVNVIPLPLVNLGNDTTICIGDSVLLNPNLTVGNTTICDKSSLPANLQQGLVAFYPFCGNSIDKSGNGHNGIDNNASYPFGLNSQCLSLQGGSNSFVNLGTWNIPDTFTISAFINIPTYNSTEAAMIFSKYDDITGNYRSLYIDLPAIGPNSYVRLAIHPDGAQQYLIDGTTYLQLNHWYHIVATYNGSNYANIYLDGVLEATKNDIPTTGIFDSNIPVYIGRDQDDWGDQTHSAFTGLIDELYVYNRVLSPQEVNQLYIIGKSSSSTCHWSTGDTTQTIKVAPNQTITYSVNVTNSNGCSASDSIKVNVAPLPIVNLGNDTSLCQGNTLNFNAGNTGSTYLWQDNSTSQIYNVNLQGTYWVNVTTPFGCKSSDTINIGYYPPPVVNLGNDTTICQGETLLLDATLINATYLWQDGSTNATFNVNQQGTYWVKVTNSNGCTASDTIHVTLTPLVVNIGNDTTICQGNNVTLDAGNMGSTYLWSTGVATQQITVNSSGAYWVNVTNGNCFNSDTININVIPKPIVNLGNDTTICHLGSITLDAGNIGSTYLWNTTATTQQINVSTTGNYWVKVNNNGCIGGDTINIAFIPLNVNIGNDTTICEGDNINLNAGNIGSTYLWNTGVATQTISAGTAGNYWVNVTNGNCTGSDTININVAQKPIVNLGNDTIMCPGDLVVLSAGAGFSSYLWSDGSTQSTLNVNNPGTYTVTVSNSGCKATDLIVIAECNSDIWVPNVFTPNDDGKNDTFHPVCTNITDISMYIYNRWGNQIYEGTGAILEWDGKYQGTTCPDGVYYFLIKYTQKDNGHTTQKQLHGSVTLLR